MGYQWNTQNPRAVLCLIHGICEHAGRYDRMAQMFTQSGLAVIGMDLRGHGCSSGRRGHCAPRNEVLKDIDQLLRYADCQYPGLPIVLYGHSLGGNIVLDYRVRGMLSGSPAAYIISGPWLGLVRKVPKHVRLILKAAHKVKPDFAINANLRPAHLGNPKMIMGDGRKALFHNSITVQTALEAYKIGRALEKGSHKGNNGGVEKPMLLMHGEFDSVCSIESTRAFASLQGDSCTYIEWPGYFHELHNGNLQKDGTEVIQTMIDWIIQTLPEVSD